MNKLKKPRIKKKKIKLSKDTVIKILGQKTYDDIWNDPIGEIDNYFLLYNKERNEKELNSWFDTYYWARINHRLITNVFKSELKELLKERTYWKVYEMEWKKKCKKQHQNKKLV